MSSRLLVPLDQVPAGERAAVVDALAADLARRLEPVFPDDENYRRSVVIAPAGSFEEARGLLELRVTHGREWGLRVRLDPVEDRPAVRILVDARPPWVNRAFGAVALVAGLAAGGVGAWGWWHGGQAAAVILALPTFGGLALLGLLLIAPLRWRAARAHRADTARVASEVEAALAALRATHPAVGVPRRAFSPATLWGLGVLTAGGLAAATVSAALSPALDAGWLCLLAPLAALFGCIALALLVRFALAVLGLAEGGRLVTDDDEGS